MASMFQSKDIGQLPWVAEHIRKQDPYMYYLQETHQNERYTHTLKVKGGKKLFYAKGKGEKLGQQYLYLKSRFIAKTVVKDKKGHYIMIKGTIH